MTDYRSQLHRLLEALEVISPSRFSWFGVRSRTVPPGIDRALAPELRRIALIRSLSTRLYEDFYLPGGARAQRDREATWAAGATGDLASALSAANRGRECWDKGWELRGEHDRGLVVHKGGLSLRVAPEDYQRPSGSVRLPKEMLGMSPGFYTALGDVALVDGDTVRLYWNLTPSVASEFMRLCTWALNSARLPFRLKVVSDASRFDRCDTAVVYLERKDFASAADALVPAHRSLQARLLPMIPALTKALRPGVGLAESPPGGSSFGQHRCDLIANALVDAYEEGAKSRAERMGFIEQRFSEAGLTVDVPFLSPRSRDLYSWTS